VQSAGTPFTHTWAQYDVLRLIVTGAAGVGSGITTNLQLIPAGTITPIDLCPTAALPSGGQNAALNGGNCGFWNGGGAQSRITNFTAGSAAPSVVAPTPPTTARGAFNIRSTNQ
jgi:hypothetical protein